MQDVLSSVTAALLALHSVLGCCWHHVHSSVEPAAATASMASEHASDAGQGNHKVPCSCDDEHSGNQNCQANRCVFARTSASERHVPTPVDLLPGYSAAEQRYISEGISAHRPVTTCATLHALPSLHLLYQVFLI
jgi:hypothetical protein